MLLKCLKKLKKMQYIIKSMKRLNDYISEKLIINKNFKNPFDFKNIETLLNLDWFNDGLGYYGCKQLETYDMFCDLIEKNGKTLNDTSDIMSEINSNKDTKTDYIYFGAFNKEVEESLVFRYDKKRNIRNFDRIAFFVSGVSNSCFIYKEINLNKSGISPLSSTSSWLKEGETYCFSIPNDLYDKIDEMYDIIKKEYRV